MTTHETDRPAGYDPVEEDDQTVGSAEPAGEHEDRTRDPDADVSDASLEEPVDDDAGLTQSRDQGALDEDTDEADYDEADYDEADYDEADHAEPELVDTDPTDEPAAPDSDPLQRLAPVGPDSEMDPGTGSYQDRWSAIQAGFIDDPRRTVESASSLMDEVWDETVRAITDDRAGIDGRWKNTEISTDDLRAVMQDYRALYGRLTRVTSD